MLPASLKAALQDHLQKAKMAHKRDMADGWGRVILPDALDRRHPNAPKEWRRQWVFPREIRWKNTKTGEEGRHHVDESISQKSFKQAFTVRNHNPLAVHGLTQYCRSVLSG